MCIFISFSHSIDTILLHSRDGAGAPAPTNTLQVNDGKSNVICAQYAYCTRIGAVYQPLWLICCKTRLNFNLPFRGRNRRRHSWHATNMQVTKSWLLSGHFFIAFFSRSIGWRREENLSSAYCRYMHSSFLSEQWWVHPPPLCQGHHECPHLS